MNRPLMPHEQIAHPSITQQPDMGYIEDVLRTSERMLTKLADSRDAYKRLYEQAQTAAVDNGDRLEAIAAVLAQALGYASHGNKPPEDFVREAEVILRGLRGEL